MAVSALQAPPSSASQLMRSPSFSCHKTVSLRLVGLCLATLAPALLAQRLASLQAAAGVRNNSTATQDRLSPCNRQNWSQDLVCPISGLMLPWSQKKNWLPAQSAVRSCYRTSSFWTELPSFQWAWLLLAQLMCRTPVLQPHQTIQLKKPTHKVHQRGISRVRRSLGQVKFRHSQTCR